MKKRIFSLISVLSIIAMLFPSAVTVYAAQSGSCGDNLTWEIDSTGKIMTITGTGAMEAPNLSNSVARRIEKIVIENGATNIANHAFLQYSGLKEVSIPSSVTSIGSRAFASCTALESVSLPKVKSIGSGAFEVCRVLTSVNFGSSLQTIGEEAFRNCGYLESISLPDTVTSIGDSAFTRCTSVTSISLGSSLQTIGDHAFLNCSGFQRITLPTSLKTIGISAFQNCRKLTSVTIPKNVTSIGYSAFSNCSKLASFSVNSSNQYYTTENSVLFNKSKTELIAYPPAKSSTSYTIPRYVSSIQPMAFCGCTKLTSFSVNSSNQYYSASSGVLFNKDKTELIAYPAGKTASSYTIPSGVTVLSVCSFVGNSNLEEITIADTVKTIASSAFEGCVLLNGIVIPESVEEIGDYAFSNCNSMTYAVINANITELKECVFYVCEELETVVLPDSLKIIGEMAFSDCYYLSEITIPEGVVEIRSGAFEYCESLQSIEIPDSVETIEYAAFAECMMLERLVIGKGVTYIGDTFYSCNLSEVYYRGTEEQFYDIDIEDYFLLEEAEIIFLNIPDDPGVIKVNPDGASYGDTVILGLYSGGRLVDTQTAIYNGRTLTFNTDVLYTTAKVMVWDSVSGMMPQTTPEYIR